MVYHRTESSTQTRETADKQIETGEIWGYPARFSPIPKVKAYPGPLPLGERGIEFETDVWPDPGCPPSVVYWSGPRDGVEADEFRAKIWVKITRSYYGA